MNCKKCGGKIDPDPYGMGLPRSIAPEDRVCFPCYEALTASFVKHSPSQLHELIEALKELTDNGEQASHWLPHILLQNAVKRGKKALADIGEDYKNYTPKEVP